MSRSEELAQAAFDGDVVKVRRLIAHGADINGEGRIWNPLHAAIENQDVECVRLLITLGADLERRAAGDLSPLAHAVDIAIDGTAQRGGGSGDEPTELIRLLLTAGVAVDEGAMQLAHIHESGKIISLLTQHKQAD